MLSEPVSNSDHIQGSKNAPNTLLEYGDFQCAYCGQAYFAVKALQQQMGNDLRFAFRNFPLEQHEYAMQAAEAVEAAGSQGKYWGMFDLLFDNQDALDMESLLGYAKQIGLAIDQFRGDLDSHKFLGEIEKDKESGAQSNVEATPTYFVNGEEFEGMPDEQGLLAAFTHFSTESPY